MITKQQRNTPASGADQTPSAVSFKEAIEIALADGLPELARELAHQGSDLYPSDEDLSKAASILAPPQVVIADRASGEGIAAQMQWLKAHASEYRGLWIALGSEGFMAAASRRRDLVAQLGSQLGLATLITRIP